jgi:hypothetical protein
MALSTETKSQDGQQLVSKGTTGKETLEKSLFDDAIASTVLSVSVFTLILLRKLARKDRLSEEDAKELLNLPVSNSRLLILSDKYADLLTKFRDKDYLKMEHEFRSQSSRPSSTTVLCHFIGDELAEEECAYIMGHDDYRKQIFLTFRGSITLTDWYQDFKLMISHVPNPLAGVVEDQPENVGIHLGFRNYMHGPPSSLVEAFGKMIPSVHTTTNVAADTSPSPDNEENGDENSEGTKTKMDVICEQLRSLKEKYPDDPIFLSGHSLGGALALITALTVAADPILGSLPDNAPPGKIPVTCLVIGNPKPGDRAFANAIHYLERKKKLLCCCFHNYLDIVPMMPPNVALSDTGFWHPGFRLVLYKHQYELGRGDSDAPMVYTVTGCCRSQGLGWAWTKRFSKTSSSSKEYVTKKRINLHNFREYMDRLLNQKDELVELSFQGLYHEMWKEEIKNASPEIASLATTS